MTLSQRSSRCYFAVESSIFGLVDALVLLLFPTPPTRCVSDAAYLAAQDITWLVKPIIWGWESIRLYDLDIVVLGKVSKKVEGNLGSMFFVE